MKSKFETSDVPNSNVLIKPSYYNYNTRKSNNRNSYYRKSFSQPPVANHSKLVIEYKGDKYKYIGTENPWIELENKEGKRILNIDQTPIGDSNLYERSW